jgi:hypothetical protein
MGFLSRETFQPLPQIVQLLAIADKRNIGKPAAEDRDHSHQNLNDSISLRGGLFVVVVVRLTIWRSQSHENQIRNEDQRCKWNPIPGTSVARHSVP